MGSFVNGQGVAPVSMAQGSLTHLLRGVLRSYGATPDADVRGSDSMQIILVSAFLGYLRTMIVRVFTTSLLWDFSWTKIQEFCS